MSIENDIQQKSFKSPYHKVMVNLMYSHNWLTARMASTIKPFGITQPQYNVLRILRGQYPKPATVNLIIERMLDKMSNASRLVDKLLLKKLVERKTCPNDRRAVDIVITQEGLNLLTVIDQQLGVWERNFSGLSESEAEQLSDLLDKMRSNA